MGGWEKNLRNIAQNPGGSRRSQVRRIRPCIICGWSERRASIWIIDGWSLDWRARRSGWAVTPRRAGTHRQLTRTPLCFWHRLALLCTRPHPYTLTTGQREPQGAPAPAQRPPATPATPNRKVASYRVQHRVKAPTTQARTSSHPDWALQAGLPRPANTSSRPHAHQHTSHTQIQMLPATSQHLPACMHAVKAAPTAQRTCQHRLTP